jgi:HEPN domain-containing protein
LKAFLVWRRVEFPKTHSIGQLLDLLSALAPELAASLADAISLTPFGAEIRYPGDSPELLPGEERTVFNLAERTRGAILAQLDEHLSGG